MRIASRPRSAPLPGIIGTVRVDRRTGPLLARLRPGDIAVLDHVDLDRATAQRLVDAGVAAVVNTVPMISGRFPNLGPEVLAAAGLPVIDGIGAAGLAALRDGSTVRLHEGQLYAGDALLASGREVDLVTIRDEMEAARGGLTTQLESFTSNSIEFLRREQDLLLHGHGVPVTATRIVGRPVVVAARGHDHAAELRLVRTYLREQQPVVIAVDRAADDLLAQGHVPDVIVLDAGAAERDLPTAKTLKAARDVVVRVERGGGDGGTGQLERLGVRPLRFESSATAEDVALILADAGGAATIVGVGLHATLDELLDRQRAGLASTYLTRLKVGPRLVDAACVPYLYSGRVRPHHLFLVMLAGFVALAAAIAVTPVGQEWFAGLADAVRGLTAASIVSPSVQLRTSLS